MNPLEGVFWLALCIYHEARGEPPEGQYLVAKSVLNRSYEREMTIKDVVLQPWQYSWANEIEKTKVKDYNAMCDCIIVANKAIFDFANGDKSGGVNHYIGDYMEPPSWTKDMDLSLIHI